MRVFSTCLITALMIWRYYDLSSHMTSYRYAPILIFLALSWDGHCSDPVRAAGAAEDSGKGRCCGFAGRSDCCWPAGAPRPRLACELDNAAGTMPDRPYAKSGSLKAASPNIGPRAVHGLPQIGNFRSDRCQRQEGCIIGGVITKGYFHDDKNPSQPARFNNVIASSIDNSLIDKPGLLRRFGPPEASLPVFIL